MLFMQHRSEVEENLDVDKELYSSPSNMKEALKTKPCKEPCTDFFLTGFYKDFIGQSTQHPDI